MLPMDLKVDKEGLLYLADEEVLKASPLLIDKRNFQCERYYYNGFYRIKNSDEYIVKYSYTIFTKKEREAIKNMLYNLVNKQSSCPDVEFPIGYYMKDRKLAGLIVKYYKNAISSEQVFDMHDIFAISKYYAYDDGAVRNLFHWFYDVLELSNKLFDEGIYYIDLNPGNLLLVDNQIKLIDFDHNYIKFDNKDKCLQSIMGIYEMLLKEVLQSYRLPYNNNEEFVNYDQAKTLTKKIEDKIIKGR